MARGWESEDLEPAAGERVISKRQFQKPPRDEWRCQALTVYRSESGKHRCERYWTIITEDGRRFCTLHFRMRNRVRTIDDDTEV